MRDPKKQKKALAELREMLTNLSKRDHVSSYFALGKVKARKVLADGTIVHFSVTEPGHYAKPRR